MARGNMDVSRECGKLRDVLGRVGDKWSLQIVGILGESPHYFNDLRHRIDGISQRMLTLTLRRLERDGLVARTVFPTNPPRVRYELTTLGDSLLEPVKALGDWAREHQTAIELSRRQFDAAHPEPATRYAVSSPAVTQL